MNFMQRLATTVAALGAVLALAGCERGAPFERPPVDSVQSGYRGTGMLQVYNPRILEPQIEQNQPPAALPPAPSEGPKASQVYQNVKVLGHLSAAEFVRHMTAITAWVAPNEGCGYTCHRGQPVPSAIWFKSNPQPYGSNFMGDKAGQNHPAPSVALSSLPNDPFTPFLLEANNIRVNGPTALPSGNRQSIKQAEWTYGLMTHMSSALGVNCTYCHNSRSFQTWEGNPPQRLTAWFGIRMARDLNTQYMEPLTDNFPAHRKGETGDVAKLNCATCHQGAYKPLYGAPMLKDYPELAGPGMSTMKLAKQ